MIFFLLCPIFCTKSLLALGIWAGKETIGTRVLAQAKTWMRFWSQIYVFTDEIYEKDANEVRKAAFPCNIQFIVLKNLSDHLEDTEWTNRWYFAQARFVPAIHKLWELEPDVSWYVFGDDDTYFFREPLVRKLSSINGDRPLVIGKVWCSNNQFTELLDNPVQCLPFAQGGAGISISHGFMEKIGPFLLECNSQFNHPDFPGSMRFAFCAERNLGDKEWSIDNTIIHWPEGFHADPPEKELKFGTISTSPATFHRIFENRQAEISLTHTANYTDISRNEYIADLSQYAYSKISVPLGSYTMKFDWYFGYILTLESVKEPFLKAKGGWTAKTSENSTIISFTQEYERNVKITLLCDERFQRGPKFFKFLDDEGSHPAFRMSCARINTVFLG